MKLLCLGNNTTLTDTQALSVAHDNNLPFYGLISDIDEKFDIKTIKNGCYHSSVLDLSKARFDKLINAFDKILVLDQKYSEWEHPNTFYNTVNWTKNHNNVEYLNSEMDLIFYWQEVMTDNPSICIYPFIEYVAIENTTVVCCRSHTPVSDVNCDFVNDPNYKSIRDSMIQGQPIQHCTHCYKMEDNYIISPRIIETIEWANRLNLSNIAELEKIKSPSYYEIRPSNKCNLQCRMCFPGSSHLIHNEYIKLDLTPENKYTFVNFDIINFTNLKKLYIAGGEPLIDKNVYTFLNECVDNNTSDFELIINTNATKLNNKFKSLIRHLPNTQFTISIDGYKDINHYVRWPSKWDEIIDNVDYLINNKHQITFNVSVSIYTITTLDKILKFLDTKYNGIHVHIQAIQYPVILSPYNFPNPSIVLKAMNTIKTLDLYNTNIETKSLIDNFIKHYNNNPMINGIQLTEFFRFNKTLDKSRNISLKDYIPDLAVFDINV